ALPAGAQPFGGPVGRQCLEQSVAAQRLAVAPGEVIQHAVATAAPFPYSPQGAELEGGDAGVVDQFGAAEPLERAAVDVVLGKAGNAVDGDVERVEEQAARRREGAAAFGFGEKQRVQGVGADEVGSGV